MNPINKCPSTLTAGFTSFSKTGLKNLFSGKKVSPILPYNTPFSNAETDNFFDENIIYMSLSGVQEKFSMLLQKNKLRLITEGEQGTYILKPIPKAGKKADQMPANEHLTMQIAKQLFGIKTAENALIFFKDGTPAYITKRFDVAIDKSKLAQDDFASLTGKTPQTHGEHYKYEGNYLDLFLTMKKYLPAYKTESPKLLQLLIFNYLFSNGDAHLKNFSIVETAMGDYCLSPAYDLLNTRIHVSDSDFGLADGLLPRHLAKGKIQNQFALLAKEAEIPSLIFWGIITKMISKSDAVQKLIDASFLNISCKKNYWQSYQKRLQLFTKK